MTLDTDLGKRSCKRRCFSFCKGGNERVKFDKLCIRDSKTGLTSCIDSKKNFYLVNNKDRD